MSLQLNSRHILRGMNKFSASRFCIPEEEGETREQQAEVIGYDQIIDDLHPMQALTDCYLGNEYRVICVFSLYKKTSLSKTMLAFKVKYCYFAHPIFWRTYSFSAEIRSQFNQKFVCSEEEKTTVT